MLTTSLRYRAPECLLTDGYYTYKMDIWSVGCVFFEIMAFVHFPFAFILFYFLCFASFLCSNGIYLFAVMWVHQVFCIDYIRYFLVLTNSTKSLKSTTFLAPPIPHYSPRSGSLCTLSYWLCWICFGVVVVKIIIISHYLWKLRITEDFFLFPFPWSDGMN